VTEDDTKPLGRDPLPDLRALERSWSQSAKELRRKASEHEANAARVSRQIADLPCDVDRTRDELILHLGWHHKRRPPLGMRKPGLVAVHNKILEGN
jgi:hypothetical protein